MKMLTSNQMFRRLAVASLPLAAILLALYPSGGSAQTTIYNQTFSTSGSATTLAAMGIDWHGVYTVTGNDPSADNPMETWAQQSASSLVGLAAGTGTSANGGIIAQTKFTANTQAISYYSNSAVPFDTTNNSYTFSWEEKDTNNTGNTNPGSANLLLQQGGQWYVSASGFTCLSNSTSSLCSVTYNPTAANWLLLSSSTPINSGVATGSGQLTLSSATVNLSGSITGFGVLALIPDGNSGTVGTWWNYSEISIDNYAITQTAITPEPTTFVLSAIGSVVLLNITRRRRI